MGQRGLSGVTTTYCFFSLSFSSVALGVLLEPLPALPDGEVVEEPLAEPLGEPPAEPLAEPLVVPPEAESFFAGSAAEDGELGVLVVPEAEPDAEPDGELGLVAEPDDEVPPEPGVVARRSPAWSPQAVSMPAPSVMEIATAKAESLILVGLRWFGVETYGASFGPITVRWGFSWTISFPRQ
jgi:hypothetical protein